MSDDALLVLLVVALGFGGWYLRHSLRKGEAPGPPYGIRHADAPFSYWFFTLTFGGVLLLGAIAAGLLVLERFGVDLQSI